MLNIDGDKFLIEVLHGKFRKYQDNSSDIKFLPMLGTVFAFLGTDVCKILKTN